MNNQQAGTTEPLYRIHWRINSTGATGHSDAAFSRDVAELWVMSLNADQDNKALGMFHWLEAVGYDESVTARD